MKKLIALLLAVFMLVGMTACGTQEETAAPTATEAVTTAATEAAPADDKPYAGTKLKMWMPPYNDETQSYWEDRMVTFQEETGIEVEVAVIPWGDMSTKYMSGFMSGEGPDVFYMTRELMYDIVDAGIALELSPYFTQEEIDEQLMWSSATAMGGQYAVPFGCGIGFRGIAFNMDLLNAAGVEKTPSTWAELIDAALKVKEAGICEYPVLYPMTAENASMLVSFFPTIWSAGGDILSEDGTQVTADSPEVLAAVQYLYDLIYTYEVLSTDCTSLSVSNVEELFLEGKVAIAALEGKYLYNNTPTFEADCILGVTDGNHDVMTFSPCDMISVNAASENLDASLVLLKWLITGEQRVNFRDNQNASALSINASVPAVTFEQEFIQEALSLLGKNTRPVTVAKGYSTMVEVIYTNMQLMAMGELSPEDTVAAIAIGCEAALNG